jgi:outer membrane protein assembly factor BamB
MRRRLVTRGSIAALTLLGLVTGFLTHARADDKKGKKDKEKDAVDSPIESADARAVLEKVTAKIKAEAWQDAFAAARELCDKHGDKLIQMLDDTDGAPPSKGGTLHLSSGAALRRKLATLPAEGREAFAKSFGEEAQRRLAQGRATADTTLLQDTGDRFFALDDGAEALLLAGDHLLERGCTIGATAAWHDVYELHPNVAERLKAAKRLVAVLPALGDPGTAADLARSLADSELEGHDALARAAREAATALEDQEIPDVAVDGSGGLAPLGSAADPGEVAYRVGLTDATQQLTDWRSEPEKKNPWGQPMAVVRRMLTGSAATEDYLLVHLGKSVFAYNAEDFSDEDGNVIAGGSSAWNVGGGESGLKSYLHGLESSGALPRFGLTVEGKRAYATLRAAPIDDAQTPRGRLVAIALGRGKIVWDTLTWDEADDEPVKKKKGEKEAAASSEDKPDARLSYIGTPVFGGDRIFCPAASATAPNETYVTAVDARTGKLLWKRPLAVSGPINAQTNPWENQLPRAMPTPALALSKGALIAVSNNGCIAAFDGTDGRVLWARTYERDEEQGGRGNPWRRTPEEIKTAIGRGYNPPLPMGDMVLALPSDSAKMNLVRVSDGTLETTHGRTVYDYLLGVSRGRIILAGETGVAGYLVKYHVKGEKRACTIEAEWTGALNGKSKEVGRGVLAGRWAYVPTAKGIVAFKVTGDGGGNAKKKVCLEWGNVKQEMGDLVLGGGRFFSVGARYAHAYKEEE